MSSTAEVSKAVREFAEESQPTWTEVGLTIRSGDAVLGFVLVERERAIVLSHDEILQSMPDALPTR